MNAINLKIAVVLFNLGGPDVANSIRPFLLNLFRDPAIIGAPGPVRYLLGQLISRLRENKAREVYGQIGGGSPILENTELQAEKLEQALQGVVNDKNTDVRCFVAMRYWHPFIAEIVKEVKSYEPDEIILLPLYPQFSGTTSGSAINEWRAQAQRENLNITTGVVGCFPQQPGFIESLANLAWAAISNLGDNTGIRVLFTAHGLPEKKIIGGDPYQWQVEQTVESIVERLGMADLDWIICYQSRVGPMTWIGPATSDEIIRAGSQGKSVVVVPVAFVSEHLETLVELDIEYSELAAKSGVPQYVRVATVGTDGKFIDGLADLVLHARANGPGPHGLGGAGNCPSRFGGCICAENGGV